MRNPNVEAFTVEVIKGKKAVLKKYAKKIGCSMADLMRPKINELLRDIGEGD